MKKMILTISALSMLVSASPVFAHNASAAPQNQASEFKTQSSYSYGFELSRDERDESGTFYAASNKVKLYVTQKGDRSSATEVKYTLVQVNDDGWETYGSVVVDGNTRDEYVKTFNVEKNNKYYFLITNKGKSVRGNIEATH
ncbi:hypothetical protein [Paenibacillus apiarius]|uniref:Uncharacterized protein n=1 Tax=Paenibacillus apiarius TaxID=46240 RepID=A0ABT4DMP5_9BACL|nr:hypothetical protein [Paenibacillus apiarius]MCY9516040.1 hypothetical protein [Paenibacillus apiarius]MCY9518501.1 hypothetical protein [Paenibacillus apiarius]MCY9551098.1 hypothetical protein [Paenibacillus apiarius]MCY9558252.1 hypothetical protein [Paenibacillus apiarius]MCY9684652.1 hypothetical protein [Paenibacillus apiarius]